jgi:hypothetical protein
VSRLAAGDLVSALGDSEVDMSYPPFVVSFAATAIIASSVHSQTLVRVDQPSTPRAVTLIYEPESGNLSLDTGGELLTSFLIGSKEGILTGTPRSYTRFADDLLGCITPEGDLACTVGDYKTLFIGEFDGGGFGNLDFETIAEPNLTAEFLLTDVEAVGGFLGGGALDKHLSTSPHLYIVPEPSSMLLCVGGFIGLLAFGRQFTIASDQHRPAAGCRRRGSGIAA